ncbi:phototropin-1-like [Aristolochia californica]|uniref:phototropin-1-like n=1 Tax=Aristolochia californica TaxID=171875 RepID=UPI0035E33277
MEPSNLSPKPSLIPPMPRDSRGSLEVFNPSTFSSKPGTTSRFSQFPTRQHMEDGHGAPETQEAPNLSKSGRATEEIIPPWMAIKDTNGRSKETISIFQDQKNDASPSIPKQNEKEEAPLTGEVGQAAQRAAEWGLVLKTDVETGKLQGVRVRTSGEDSNKGGTSRRDSGNSGRSSEESEAGKDKGLPRVSKELKEALSAFQQTFVVSDATKPDYPIMYASAGFFKIFYHEIYSFSN